MSNLHDVELRKAQSALLISQMLKDKQIEPELAIEFVKSVNEFLGNSDHEIED